MSREGELKHDLALFTIPLLPRGDTVTFVYGMWQRMVTLMSIMPVESPFREAYHTAEYP